MTRPPLDFRPTDTDRLGALYACAGVEGAKMGPEIELAFIDYNSGQPMSIEQNSNLLNAVREKDKRALDLVHREPTSEVMEATAGAYPFKEIKKCLYELEEMMRLIMTEANRLGLKRSYFQDLPQYSAEFLMRTVVDVPRFNQMFSPDMQNVHNNFDYFKRYHSLCKSVHVSVSAPSQDKALEDVRRLYMLAPFLFLMSDNSSGYIEGTLHSGHMGMHLRHKALQDFGGNILEHAFTAENGEDFFAKHIEYVMNKKMYWYYDAEGMLQGKADGISFNQLREQGLDFYANYFDSQSQVWPDVKIATLQKTGKDGRPIVFGHRYEARMFGVGMHQHQTAMILVGGLAFDAEFSQKVDDLLKSFGFDFDEPANARSLLETAYAAARDHNNRFFDITYGSGNMKDFARKFGILAKEMAIRNDLEQEIQPTLEICETGLTDARINRILFPTLNDAIFFQRNYPEHIWDNTAQSASQFFSGKFSTGSHLQASPDFDLT